MDVRNQFPIFLAQPQYAYLDTAATAQVPQVVLEATLAFETQFRANVHRGVYPHAERATEAYEAVRVKVANFVHADANEVIFTAGTTASMNMIARMLAERLHEDDVVLASAMEHHSALLPWLQIAKERKARVETIQLDDDYRLDIAAFEKQMTVRTKFVVVTAASNVLGTINPIAQIVDIAHRTGAMVIVDAAQLAPHAPIDFATWGADVVMFSAYKLYAPMGVGVLIIRKSLAEALAPAWLGGGTVREVEGERLLLEDIPHVFEPGTPNVSGVIGLGAAIDFMQSVGWETIMAREVELTRLMIVGLLSLGIKNIAGPMAMHDRIGVVSFGLPDIHPHDVASLVAEKGVAIRAGHHCAMPLVQPIDPRGLCRASLGMYSTEDDVASLISALEYARQTLS